MNPVVVIFVVLHRYTSGAEIAINLANITKIWAGAKGTYIRLVDGQEEAVRESMAEIATLMDPVSEIRRVDR